MSVSAAYRGFRLQALYSLCRVLDFADSADMVYHLEGFEDFDVESKDGNLLELIQVKSYRNLTLSDLSPQDPSSFFKRAFKFIEQGNGPKIKLVNFGPIGEEMRLAWSATGSHRNNVISKMENWGFDRAEAQLIIGNIELIELEENVIYDEVISDLKRSGTGIDPIHAFDLLNYWIYRQSEGRSRISKLDVLEKINSVGRFLAERTNYVQEWYTSIQPLEDLPIDPARVDQLRSEFYAGIAARYEHILAGLDFQREEKLEEIRQAFSHSPTVIVHAASGQGKSTLAYRYLYETYPDSCRFLVSAIENRQHALHIASALQGYAKALQSAMAIYIDVSPKDSDWTELVRQLSQYTDFQVLVTVREEDFRRATINAEFEYSLIDLAFDEKEARLIYDRIRGSGFPLQQLTFDDAWHRFGAGPLMEFVYLLTQTHTLRDRLEAQIKRIRKDVQESKRAADELELLRIVSVASAYDARVFLPELMRNLELPDPSLSLEMLEKEYLLHTSTDKRFITGLHPVRSRIISEILSDAVLKPWYAIAEKSLPLIPEDEWEIFVLQSFVDHPTDFDEILRIVQKVTPTTWTGLACILRALLWAGIRKYMSENGEAISEARKHFDKGWYLFADLNFGEMQTPSKAVWWDSIKDLFSAEKVEAITRMNQLWTSRDLVYSFAKNWLSKQTDTPKKPNDDLDWMSLPEVAFWAWRFELSQLVNSWISDNMLSDAMSSLSLSTLSHVSACFSLIDPTRHSTNFQQHRREIEERLANEYDILSIQEVEGLLTVHFLTFTRDEESEKTGKESRLLHGKTMERIQLMRQLFPTFEKYGSRGYGHQLPALNINHDDTVKTGIPKSLLHLPWPIRINRVAVGLANFDVRPANWDDYISPHIQTRAMIISCLEELVKGISRYFNRRKAINLLEMDAFQSQWDECISRIDHLPLLPKTAVDRWALSQPEGDAKDFDSGEQSLRIDTLIPKSVLDHIYKPYLDRDRKYFSSIRTFMEQSPIIIMINFHSGKSAEGSPQKASIIEFLKKKNVNTNVQGTSIFNLREARDVLQEYQQKFRELFGDRLDNTLLSSLEEQESDVINRLWYVWHFYVNKPQMVLPRPEKQILDRVDAAQKALLQKYSDCLAQVSLPGDCVAQIAARDVKWESSTAIWLTLDVHTPVDIYPKVEALIGLLKENMGVLDYLDLERLLLEEQFEYTVIVPTVNGRMLSLSVWPLRSTFTIMDEKPIQEKIWAYISLPASQSVLSSLGFSLWEHEDIHNANKMSESVALMSAYLSMLAELGQMPDAMDASDDKIKMFMKDRSGELSSSLQCFLDMSTVLLSRFLRLNDEEHDAHPYLVAAVSLLGEAREQVLPSKDFNSTQTVRVDEMAAYAARLQAVMPVVEHIRLLWIAETIEQLN